MLSYIEVKYSRNLKKLIDWYYFSKMIWLGQDHDKKNILLLRKFYIVINNIAFQRKHLVGIF